MSREQLAEAIARALRFEHDPSYLLNLAAWCWTFDVRSSLNLMRVSSEGSLVEARRQATLVLSALDSVKPLEAPPC